MSAHIGRNKGRSVSSKLSFWKNRLCYNVIRHHEDYDPANKTRLGKECLILQDADRLDALGAIGIARCFYTSSRLGVQLGTPSDIHRTTKHYRIEHVTPAIQHFYEKLLQLKDGMNTAYAKELAQGRHDFMVEYLERFRREWRGL